MRGRFGVLQVSYDVLNKNLQLFKVNMNLWNKNTFGNVKDNMDIAKLNLKVI